MPFHSIGQSELQSPLEAVGYIAPVFAQWSEMASESWRASPADRTEGIAFAKESSVANQIFGEVELVFDRPDKEGVTLSRVSDVRIDKPNLPAETDVRGQWERLRDLVTNRITEVTDRTAFMSNVVTFLERARKQGLDDTEVGRTFSEIGRLLESRDDAYMSDTSRIRLAKEVMAQVARPTSVRQGYHNTCIVAAIEARTYTKFPSAAAALVAQSALSGLYGAGNGALVWHKDYPGSLMPDFEALKKVPDADDRSYASQIFQLTAVNVHYAANSFTYADSFGKQRTVPAGSVRYEQVMPTGPGDNGERLMDYSDKSKPVEVVLSDGYPARWPILDGDQAVMVSNAITREYAYDTMISAPGVFDTTNNVMTTDSADHFEALLQGLKAKARFPVIVVVDTNKEPFWKDSGEGVAGGSGGSHVINVTDYRDGIVDIDNQWSEQVDHLGSNAISAQDLYNALYKRQGMI